MDFLSKLFKKTSEDIQEDNAIRAILQQKYSIFQRILKKNNFVLELMADVEDKLAGDYLFDIYYIDTHIKLITSEVFSIIENLNFLSNDKYNQLYKIFDDVTKEIKKILKFNFEIPVSDLTIPLKEITGNMVNIVGGKLAHLGEVKNRLHMPVTKGFVITSYAYKKFMEYNRFLERSNRTISALTIDNIEEIISVSKEIQEMIIASEIPDDLVKSVKDAYKQLCNGDKDIMVSLRSSAIHEEKEFSFAGQYETFINIHGDLILQKYKEVIASMFTPRAIFYYKTKGFSAGEMAMAVGVLPMIDASRSGVIYTIDPNNQESDYMIINSAFGSGKWVSGATIKPYLYLVSRLSEGNILNEVCLHEEKIELPCLTEEQIRTLSKYALAIEEHYGCPQEIEWVIGKDDQIYIMQTRPLRILSKEQIKALPSRIEKYNIIIDKGIIACKGIGFGKAFILNNEENIKEFPEGAVLVAKHSSPKFVMVMNKAAAIVIDEGSATDHMASLSREYEVPTILDTEVATNIIKNGQDITVDAIHCNIYEGRVDELLEYARKKREPFKETRLFKILERVIKHIVPLNLIDPDDENFKSENCKTFHDITHFAHETAMKEMFLIGLEHDAEDVKTVPLSAGIPMYTCLLDIGEGIESNVKIATPRDILSIPFSALLKGMKSIVWPKQKSADLEGTLNKKERMASKPKKQIYKMGEKSFAILSRDYMNFSLRLGYHFSLIEAYVGDNINDNFIRFFFKGGGASFDRRQRRIRLIKEILKKIGFNVSSEEDMIDAVFLKYKKSTIQNKLEALGRLTAYTKQLDMALCNDAVTDMYIEQFIREYL